MRPMDAALQGCGGRMKTSIVVPIRVDSELLNSYLNHFRFCSSALALVDGDNEIIVLDYGSDERYSEQIEEIASSNGQHYIRAEANRWSRSAALNRGIEVATGETILPVDADVIAPPNYATAHAYGLSGGAFFTNHGVYHLDQSVAPSVRHSALIEKPGRTVPGGWSHCGFFRSDWVKCGGYSEVYYGWGAEDDDFLRRLKSIGLVRKMIDVLPIHLWHPHYIHVQQQLGNKDLSESAERNAKIYHGK